jgi:hypothetical protein
MMALKTSPIWHQIGQGAGGFQDCIGTDYPPFAFGSGLAWVNVDREDWEDYCKEEGVPNGLDEIDRIAFATKAAQEAVGGKGAYGASAKPGAARGFARGLIEGLMRGTGGSAFVPRTLSRDASERAVRASVAASDAALAEIERSAGIIAELSRESAGEDWHEVVADAARRATAELEAARKTVSGARARLVAYLASARAMPPPGDAAAQTVFDGRMKWLAGVADKTKAIFEAAGKSAKERADSVARIASAEGV